MVKLSVIVPIYNTPQDLLEHCITSIQQNLEKLEDIEILLINDGSTEPYIEPILKGVEDRHFKYIYKEHSGISATRNIGIEIARGEYITFVDADDYLEANALQYMVGQADNTDAEMVIFGYCYNDNIKEVTRRYGLIRADERIKMYAAHIAGDKQNGYWKSFEVNVHVPFAKIYRRSVIKGMDLRFSPKLRISEDSFFNMLYMKGCQKILIDNKLVYHYVTNPKSVTHKISDVRFTNTPTLIKMMEEFIAKTPYAVDTELCRYWFTQRVLQEIRYYRYTYLTHPENHKPLRQLISELHESLSKPAISRWVEKLRLRDADNMMELKNIILLKLHLYWIFLITERKKRK